MIDKKRTYEFRKNTNLEDLLSAINQHINPLQHDESYLQKDNKIVIVLGPPRSGTTLLTQWMSTLNIFCYPTNLISRFYSNPVLGSLLQQLLFDKDFQYKDEFFDLKPLLSSFRSNVGKTDGVLSPNEFWYYWRRFYNFPDIPVDEAELEKEFDFKGFYSELTEVSMVFGKPLFLKGLIINEYFPSFLKRNPNVLVIHIHRNLDDNTVSLMNTRKQFFGNYDEWYSFKTSNYKEIKNLSPIDQIRNQIKFTNETISEKLKPFPPSRSITISYEKFCESPANLYGELVNKMEMKGAIPYTGINNYTVKKYDLDNIQFS